MDDSREQLRVLTATKGQIEVHKMHPAGPGLVKRAGNIDRAPPRSVVDRSRGQSHSLPARHVDRGQ